MAHYLLSIYQPDGPPPPRERLEPIMRDVAAVRDEMTAAGAWVFTAGLHPASTATVVRATGDDVLMTGSWIPFETLLSARSMVART